uniref:ribosomal protein L2 n=1 Tax=Thonningia sanguinea TaxID=1618145 RepID=UPI0026E199CF|nr:ribosomal protein L2 [Thonningia sanguinea]WJE89146.1 ribosomal protein L2 [Thonningia sanguinea]
MNKKLIYNYHSSNGRSSSGIIILRYRGGGHKYLYRKINCKSRIETRILTIEYDPNRTSFICFTHSIKGKKYFILYSRGIKIGTLITTSNINIGNSIVLEKISLGSTIHNIEINLGKGGQLVKSAGCMSKIISKDGNSVSIKLPSKKISSINSKCYASLGQVGNLKVLNNNNKNNKKAGYKRWIGKKPKVRGTAMNAVDHPHGGGKGKSSIGKKKPSTIWGYRKNKN